MKLHHAGYCCFILLFHPLRLGAETNSVMASGIREAAMRSVGLIDRASSVFLTKRDCFACHSQTLSVLVLSEAMRVGIEVNRDNLRNQRDRSYEALNASRIDTFGYALWALDAGKQTPDSNTAALVELILKDGDPRSAWRPSVDRPPAEASSFTTTFLALRGARRFGTEQQSERIRQRLEGVRQWIETDPPAPETEDHVFRLRLARELQLPGSRIDELARKLVATQSSEGGWAQRPGMASDAYATGSALTALREASGVPASNRAWQQGIQYLLRTQMPDGSWRVVSRVKPIQEYFESGFPHGTNQFISAFATGWATLALLASMEDR